MTWTPAISYTLSTTIVKYVNNVAFFLKNWRKGWSHCMGMKNWFRAHVLELKCFLEHRIHWICLHIQTTVPHSFVHRYIWALIRSRWDTITANSQLLSVPPSLPWQDLLSSRILRQSLPPRSFLTRLVSIHLCSYSTRGVFIQNLNFQMKCHKPGSINVNVFWFYFFSLLYTQLWEFDIPFLMKVKRVLSQKLWKFN